MFLVLWRRVWWFVCLSCRWSRQFHVCGVNEWMFPSHSVWRDDVVRQTSSLVAGRCGRAVLLLLLWRASTQFTLTHHCWSLTVRNVAQWTQFCWDKQGQQVTGSLSVWFCSSLCWMQLCVGHVALCEHPVTSLSSAGHMRPSCRSRTRLSPRWRPRCRSGPYCGSSSTWWEAQELVNYAYQWFNECACIQKRFTVVPPWLQLHLCLFLVFVLPDVRWVQSTVIRYTCMDWNNWEITTGATCRSVIITWRRQRLIPHHSFIVMQITLCKIM